MDVGKTKLMRISKEICSIADCDRSETTGEFGIFQLFG
jgi:hypothetical protein